MFDTIGPQARVASRGKLPAMAGNGATQRGVSGSRYQMGVTMKAPMPKRTSVPRRKTAKAIWALGAT